MDEIMLIKNRLCFRNNLLNDQVKHRVFMNVICIIVIIISWIKFLSMRWCYCTKSRNCGFVR